MKQLLIVLFSTCVFIFPVFAVESECKSDPSRNGAITCDLPNPFAQAGNPDAKTTPTEIIGTVIRVVLSIIGALTLAMFVYGGFTWLTSAGSEDKVKKGTQTMVWATIGVIVVFSSYLVLSTFLDYLMTNKTVQ